MSCTLADIVARFVHHEEHPPQRSWADSFETPQEERAVRRLWDRWESQRRALIEQMRAAVKGGA